MLLLLAFLLTPGLHRPLAAGSTSLTDTQVASSSQGPAVPLGDAPASGLFLDLRSFGARCDGLTDDSLALQTALNAWAVSGGTLLSPSGAACIFRKNLVVSFRRPDSWSSPHILDFQGAKWLSEVPSGIALQFRNEGPGEVNASQIELENGMLWESGKASLALDFDGGGGPEHFMSNILLDNFHVHTVGDRTSGVRFRAAYQSRCVSSTVSGQTRPQIYGWWFEEQARQDQATGDFTWVGCDSTGYDHGLYSTGVNEVRVFGGTFLQTWEENIFIDTAVGTVLTDPHVENGWFGNESRVAQRAEIFCAGCFLDGVVGLISRGNANAAIRLYVSAASNEAGIRGGYFWGISPAHPFAFVGTGPGGHITVEGWGPSDIRDYVGNSSVTYIAEGNLQSQRVTTAQLVSTSILVPFRNAANHGGVQLNRLACGVGENPLFGVVRCPASARNWLGVASGGAMGQNPGSALLAVSGIVSVAVDGEVTAGHYAVPSALIPGAVHDPGGSPPAGVPLVGRFVSRSDVSTQPARMLLYPSVPQAADENTDAREQRPELAVTANAEWPAQKRQVILRWPLRQRIRVHQITIFSNEAPRGCAVDPVITTLLDGTPAATFVEHDGQAQWTANPGSLPKDADHIVEVSVTTPATACAAYGSIPHVVLDYASE